MPYVRRYKKYAKKARKPYPKRYRRNRLSFAKAPVPNKMFTKMIYVENDRTFDPPLGAPGVFVFSANGLYDPNITQVGHQPRGFDQLMQLYDHYVVLGSTITVQFYNTHANNNICFVALKDSATPQTSLNDYLEGRNVAYKCGTGTLETHSITTITKNFSAKKFLGRSSVLSDPELKGSASANPIEQAYYHIGLGTHSPTADEGTVRFVARISYLVCLIEPKQPAQS